MTTTINCAQIFIYWFDDDITRDISLKKNLMKRYRKIKRSFLLSKLQKIRVFRQWNLILMPMKRRRINYITNIYWSLPHKKKVKDIFFSILSFATFVFQRNQLIIFILKNTIYLLCMVYFSFFVSSKFPPTYKNRKK